ncbi:MAG: BLUF domain-containing protein [Spirochaetales bacterium]|nr:BLUF domain-containing protein [Spirochaetales bacterium]
MKRLTYISRFGRELSAAEIDEIAATSITNNQRDGLTGMLFCFRQVFYQILEGDEEKLDKCYARILGDPRHKDIFCLGIEENISERLYPEWSMKTVNLDLDSGSTIDPVKRILDALLRNHQILKAYTPTPILDAIQAGKDPRALTVRPEEKIILFSDLFSSTTLTEVFPAAEVNRLLDIYYGASIDSILGMGGTVSKLTGDGLMAYFPASLADRALEAVLHTIKRLKEEREMAAHADILRFLFAGFGITAGKVLVGNIGTISRLDYTLLGDAVNSAARLEGLTRRMIGGKQYAVVFDQNFQQKIQEFPTRKLGRVMVKGKSQPIDLYAPDRPDVILPELASQLKEKIMAR